MPRHCQRRHPDRFKQTVERRPTWHSSTPLPSRTVIHIHSYLVLFYVNQAQMKITWITQPPMRASASHRPHSWHREQPISSSVHLVARLITPLYQHAPFLKRPPTMTRMTMTNECIPYWRMLAWTVDTFPIETQQIAIKRTCRILYHGLLPAVSSSLSTHLTMDFFFDFGSFHFTLLYRVSQSLFY